MAQTSDELKQEINQTREQLADTADALAYKADVPTRTKDWVGDKKDAIVSAVGGASATEVILCKDGTRKVPQEIALPIGSEHDLRLLSSNPVIVVTGGARGVTAACMAALAEIAPVRLALFGRTKLAQEPPAFAHAGSEAELKAAIFHSAQKSGEAVSPREASSRASRILAARAVAALGESTKAQ